MSILVSSAATLPGRMPDIGRCGSATKNRRVQFVPPQGANCCGQSTDEVGTNSTR
jgi:hypothetical protein